VDLTALAFLALVLAVKEAGLPIPVPGDLLVIGAGVAVTPGGLPAPLIVVVLILATVVGGIVQFLLVRGRARTIALGLLARFGLRPATIERGADRLRRGGAATVAVTRMTPGVRIVAIASSAIAGVALAPFVTGLIVGNGVFLTGHFLLGLVVGEPAVRLVAGAGTGLIVAGIGLAALGAAGWWLIARRRSRVARAAGADPAARELAPLDWTDACCPACLALAVVVPVPPQGR
jgi:membrane protein DedA with SNARE-associated domain